MRYNPNSIILQPIQTEKTTDAQKLNKYTFKVDKRANKKEIMRAIKDIFKVKVLKCSIINMPGKLKRRRFRAGYTSSFKKAIVTLPKGETIETIKIK